MTPKELVWKWVELFNKASAHEIATLYHENAINYQVPNEPVIGRQAIFEMFESEFSQYEMTCIIENLFEDGEWAILEWKGPEEKIRGCGLFHIVKGKIKLQRGYWDKLTFLREQGLPVPG